MNRPISIFAVTIAAAASAALAQVGSYTDVAPYTDIVPTARASGGAPGQWMGQLSRADVKSATRQAQREGTIAVGDAVGYPYPMKGTPDTQSAQSRQTAPAQVMGGPPSDLSSDGYRFVGGEAGWILVGPQGTQR